MQSARPAAGFFWMLLTGILFVGVTAVVKHVGDDVPPPQAAFLRYVLGLVFLVPFVGALRGMTFQPGILRLFVLRGIFHTVGVTLWFYAMTQIPIAEVTALNYLSPVFVTIGAALFLGERFAARRMVAIVTAFVGVLLILRPGFREVSAGHLAILGTAVTFSGSYLIAKRTADLTSPGVVVAMLSILVTIGLAPLAAAVWVTPTPVQLAWLFLVATLATAAHYTMTLAFRAAPVSQTQPVTLLQLVWAALLGWAVFGEALDPWVLSGGTIIVAAVSFIAWRETRAGRRPGVSGRAGRPVAPEPREP
jgi:drug/metabolite transporter (DMT)-like permease